MALDCEGRRKNRNSRRLNPIAAIFVDCHIPLGSLGTRGEPLHLVQFIGAVPLLCLGCLGSPPVKGRAPSWKMASRLLLFTVAVALWTSAQGFFLREYAPFSGPLFYVVGYALVGIGCVLLLLGFLGIPRRYTPRSFVQLGKVSYGLYVFHRLSQQIASRLLPAAARSELWTGRLQSVLRLSAILVVALLLTIVLALFSYRFLEMP